MVADGRVSEVTEWSQRDYVTSAHKTVARLSARHVVLSASFRLIFVSKARVQRVACSEALYPRRLSRTCARFEEVDTWRGGSHYVSTHYSTAPCDGAVMVVEDAADGPERRTSGRPDAILETIVGHYGAMVVDNASDGPERRTSGRSDAILETIVGHYGAV
ncbi:hypothetical protein BC629DRAFT_1622333 [Irpex lacteus]|nr:hypothetical protein BC629DRAFT_1622333 [Irpex lacteus]